jgi:hypothetical protein
MFFSRRMSGNALAAALLTIPAEQRVRAQWFTRNKCEWRGELIAAWSPSPRGDRIGPWLCAAPSVMSTRPLASTRYVKKEPR